MPQKSVSAPDPVAWILRLDTPLQEAGSGALAGLRFAVKDNIDVAGLLTTAACAAFARQADTHATVVQRLLDAGAQLVGKTNLDQFACGLNGTRSPHGAVPNAFDANYVSGGSSSGSAYVVATGQVDFSLGTDTAGSGRVPAGLNNIVGLKPTRGLISAAGVVPAAQSIDCVSIFAGTVGLAARVLEVAMGADVRDPYSRAAPSLPMASAALPASFRFGVPDVLQFDGDAQSQQCFEAACARLIALGGTPVSIAYAPLMAAADLLYESALVSERYAAVRDFFDAHADQVIEPVRSILAGGTRYSAADLFDAQHRLQAFAAEAAPMWREIDVLCVPTLPAPCSMEAMRAEPVARNRMLGAYTNFVNLLDLAALAVPASIRPDGLPSGITLIGKAGSDWQLAELGQRFHHDTGLTQGATRQPLGAPALIAALQPSSRTHLALAVVGAHLSGMPLNAQLTERGAVLAQRTTTAPHYRLFALAGTQPPKPGLQRTTSEGADAAAIAIEVWWLPLQTVGSFLALVPPPLALGSVELANGSWVHGFVCEGHALVDAFDVTVHGGWRPYIQSLASPAIAPVAA
jgi:allophanate hydrolase